MEQLRLPTAGNNNVAFVIWDDAALTITNPSRSVLRYLKMRVQSIGLPTDETGKVIGRKKVLVSYTDLYNVLQDTKGLKVIQTHQGFETEVVRLLEKDGMVVRRFDYRQEFPEPKLSLVRDMRFGQKALLVDGLRKNRSGLIGACTRYGKSYLILNAIRAFPDIPVTLVVPGVDLLKQTKDFLAENLDRELVQLGGGSRKKYQSEKGVTLCSADSMHKLCPGETKFILADEPHSLVTVERMKDWNKLLNARRVGFGASLEGRFDGRDKLITGLFGPVLSQRTYTQALAEGAVCLVAVVFLRVPVAHNPNMDRDAAYRKFLFNSKDMLAITEELSASAVPQDHQTLMFIDNEVQADFLMSKLSGSNTLAMAKKLTPKERAALFAKIQGGGIKRCLATNIYAQGVTFPDLRCVVNLSGGGGNTSAIQRPGRLAQVIPGKRAGIFVDFMFENTGSPSEQGILHANSMSRYNAYKKQGYLVNVVDSIGELADFYKRWA